MVVPFVILWETSKLICIINFHSHQQWMGVVLSPYLLQCLFSALLIIAILTRVSGISWGLLMVLDFFLAFKCVGLIHSGTEFRVQWRWNSRLWWDSRLGSLYIHSWGRNCWTRETVSYCVTHFILCFVLLCFLYKSLLHCTTTGSRIALHSSY